VDERSLAQIIFAFRICLPDVPLVLSTRESPRFRDGMAGVGISKMSVASRTTVGGYRDGATHSSAQFEVSDDRDAGSFCAMLYGKGLQPVFKNWDVIYRETPVPRQAAL
jgi:2-iminoacetate synthase